MPMIQKTHNAAPQPKKYKPIRYHFSGMAVGDVFYEPDDNGVSDVNNRSRKAQSISSAIYQYRQRYDLSAKFKVQTLQGFVSCERIK